MRIRLLGFCFFLLFILTAGAQNLAVEGEVMGLWNFDTVKVIGDINLPPGATLMIGPGVVVSFQGYYNFEVEGDLQVLGIPEDPVFFTVSDTTGLHDLNVPDGGWNGISLVAFEEESGPSAWFEHACFEFGKTWEGDTLHHGGAVYVSGPVDVTFLHCTFSSNHAYLSGAGLYFQGASPLVEQCYFTDNQAGHSPPQEEQYGYGGGLCGLNTKAVVRGNVFFANASTGIGGGLSIDGGDPIIEHNIFEANDSPLGGGLGILRSHLLGTISNNLVLNNTAIFFGGGIALIATRANLSNNTIVGNYGGYGGGLYFNAEAFVKVYNSILWGNWANGPAGGSVFIWDAVSVPDFYFCNIEGGEALIDGAAFTGEYVGNINKEPSFSGEGGWPWQLKPDSPVINAGIEDPGFLMLPENDLAGNPRIQLGRIDMGAFESDSIMDTSVFYPVYGLPGLVVYPNPAVDRAFVKLENRGPGSLRLWVYDTRGMQVMCLFDGFLESGRFEFNIDLKESGLKKGIYFVVAETPRKKTSARLIVF